MTIFPAKAQAVCEPSALANVSVLLSVALFLLAMPVLAAPDDRAASFLPPPPPPPAAADAAAVPEALKPAEPPAPATPEPVAPVDLGKPVTSAPLAPVDPDAIGLLTATSGGLSATLWNGTPRALVERLLAAPDFLPTASPALNGLARRLLLSAAEVPPGASASGQSLTALRLVNLLALGDADAAWKLAALARGAQVDDDTLRRVGEALLAGPDGKAVCDRMPELMAGPKAADWQKAQTVCQLQGGDLKAAQLGLDMMRERDAKDKDDVFMSLASRNVLGGLKQLPRQLTPLKPLTFALLRLSDAPLPPELYARPDAALIPDMLKAKAADDKARLRLAAKAAAQALIGAAQLADVYGDAAFAPDERAGALLSNETGPRLEALLYQAAKQDQPPQARAALLRKWAGTMDAPSLTGAAGQLLAGQVATLPATSDSNAFAATAARVLALAGKPDQALPWLDLARGPAGRLPEVAADMQTGWPLFVLSGGLTDADYGQGLKAWRAAELKPDEGDGADDRDGKGRSRRRQAGDVLSLLNAAGFAVPEEIWVRVADTSIEVRRTAMPSPVLLERLRSAGSQGRTGEAVLLSVLLAGGNTADALTPVSVIADAVRALRQAGLKADALALAREAAAGAMATSKR
jgi:hypothetical protein